MGESNMTEEELFIQTTRLIHESRQICWALRERWIEDNLFNKDENLEELINEETNCVNNNCLLAA